MGESRSRPWVVASIAVLIVLVAVDLATGPEVVVIALYGIAPLLASLGADWRSTAAVGALALLAAVISRALADDMETANGALFVFAVAALGALAAGGAAIRTRREAAAARASVLAAASEALAGPGDLAARLRAVEAAAELVADRCTIALEQPALPATASRRCPPTATSSRRCSRAASSSARSRSRRARAGSRRRRPRAGRRARARCAAAIDNARLLAKADEAYGMLDAVFARAPVGLALYDRELRLRAHQRPPRRDQRHAGRRAHRAAGRPRSLPDVEAVEDDMRRVLDTGEPLVARSSVAGSTPPRPACEREFEVSYWPVRRRGDDEVIGVGCVVFEVTERRAAERELREQTDALRVAAARAVGGRRGHGRARGDGRFVYANPAFRAVSRLHVRGAGRRCRRCSTSSSRTTSARTPAGARRCGSTGVSDPGYQLTLRRRDGHRVAARGRRRAARDRGPPPDGRGRARRHRRAPAPRPSASGCSRAPRFLAEASAAFDAVARRGARRSTRSPGCASATSPTPA